MGEEAEMKSGENKCVFGKCRILLLQLNKQFRTGWPGIPKADLGGKGRCSKTCRTDFFFKLLCPLHHAMPEIFAVQGFKLMKLCNQPLPEIHPDVDLASYFLQVVQYYFNNLSVMVNLNCQLDWVESPRRHIPESVCGHVSWGNSSVHDITITTITISIITMSINITHPY